MSRIMNVLAVTVVAVFLISVGYRVGYDKGAFSTLPFGAVGYLYGMNGMACNLYEGEYQGRSVKNLLQCSPLTPLNEAQPSLIIGPGHLLAERIEVTSIDRQPQSREPEPRMMR